MHSRRRSSDSTTMNQRDGRGGNGWLNRALWISTILTLVISMAACGGDDSANTTTSPTTEADVSAAIAELFPSVPDDIKGTVLEDFIFNTRPSRSYKFGMAVPNLPDPTFQAIVDATQKYADVLGVELVVVDAGGFDKVEKQVSQMEDLVQLGVDGILLGATNSAGLAPSVERAAEAGVPVADYIINENSGKAITFSAGNQEAIGRAECEGIAQLVPNAKVVMLSGPEGTESAEKRAEGFRTCAEEKGFTLLREQWGLSARDDAVTQMEDMIQALGDEIQGVYTFGSYMGLGAQDAIVRAGLEDQIYVATANPGGEDLDSGIDVFVDQRNFVTSTVALAALIRHIQGETVPTLLEVPVHPVTADEAMTYDWGWTLFLE